MLGVPDVDNQLAYATINTKVEAFPIEEQREVIEQLRSKKKAIRVRLHSHYFCVLVYLSLRTLLHLTRLALVTRRHVLYLQSEHVHIQLGGSTSFPT